MIINLKIKGLEEAIKQFDPQVIKKSTISAINKTVKTGKSEMSKIIREKYNIRKSDLDPKISLKFANQNNATGIVTLTGEPISLMYFNPTWQRGRIKIFKRGTATMKMKKSQNVMTVKILKGKITRLYHTFIAPDLNKNPRVFARITGSKNPRTGKEKLRSIKVKRYPSLFRKPELISRLIRRVDDALQKNFRPEFFQELLKARQRR